MYLLDSNIVIYYADKKYECLETIFQEETLYVSEITRLEVLGYHKIGDLKTLFEQLFAEFNLINISKEIINHAILIRQQRSMSLGDAIIAATALHNNLTIVSRNVKDFDWIENLTVHNPFNDR
ncbi:MAG: type II toxin-antitoxin system VapC family toxin [Methylococcaceae bacterium]